MANESLHPLLDARGNTATKHEEKAEVVNAFFALVFNSQTDYSLGSQLSGYAVHHFRSSDKFLGRKWHEMVLFHMINSSLCPHPQSRRYYLQCVLRMILGPYSSQNHV